MPRPAIHRLLILIPVLAVLCFLVGLLTSEPVGRVAPNAPSAIAPSHNTSHLTPATYVTYNYEAPGQPHRPHDTAPTYDYEPSHDFSGSLALSTADSPTDYIPSRPRSIRPQAQANAPNSQNYTYDASGIFNAAESAAASGVKEGATIYRVFGGEARGLGRSWTTVAPDAVADFRAAGGLFEGNTAEYVATARLRSLEGVTFRTALPGPTTPPGALQIPELLFESRPVPGVNLDLLSVGGWPH